MGRARAGAPLRCIGPLVLWQAGGMSGIRKLALARPPTRKVVWELGVSNFFGRWMRERGWAGFTLPLPGVVIVFYWLRRVDERPDAFVRVHEFVHVRQDQR